MPGIILGTMSLRSDLALDPPHGMQTSDARKAAAERLLCQCPQAHPPRYMRYCCSCGKRVE